jgi:hypothetical protein
MYRTRELGLEAVFIHAESKSEDILRRTAAAEFRVVYVCVEMLEGPSFARIIHSIPFQRKLLGIFVDEAHLLHDSANWRPAYTRLAALRKVVGEHIPLTAISATLPTPYRQSLLSYAGLNPSYHLINLGNHRPELSTVLIPMKNPVSSFQDLAFLLPSGTSASDMDGTLIYKDDLDILTSMFWWFQQRLSSMGLDTGLVDIIHAGLSDEHQRIVLEEFRQGKIKFLLSSEKVAVGMNFPNVKRVVQYTCHRVNIVRWEQRRGRGARSKNSSAIGYLLIEPKLLDPSQTEGEDPGMLELIQSGRCCDDVYDDRLENPNRPSLSFPLTCKRCSNCTPALLPGREHLFVMETPGDSVLKDSTTFRSTANDKELLRQSLVTWRRRYWEESWRDDWPCYGPKSLLSDGDLDEVAQHMGSITSVETLRPFVHVLHESRILPELLVAFKAAVLSITGSPVAETVTISSDELLAQSQLSLANQLASADAAGASSRRRRQPRVGSLHEGEMVMSFNNN